LKIQERRINKKVIPYIPQASLLGTLSHGKLFCGTLEKALSNPGPSKMAMAV